MYRYWLGILLSILAVLVTGDVSWSAAPVQRYPFGVHGWSEGELDRLPAQWRSSQGPDAPQLLAVFFESPAESAAYLAVAERGLLPLEPFPPTGVMCWGTPKQAHQVFSPKVSAVLPLHPLLKLSAELQTLAWQGKLRDGAPERFAVRWYSPEFERLAELPADIRVLEAGQVEPWYTVYLEAPLERVRELAHLPGVAFIERHRPVQLEDELANLIVAGQLPPSVPDYLDRLATRQLDGNGVLVVVWDDGVVNAPHLAGRVWDYVPVPVCNGTGGHGHHVASIIAGNGTGTDPEGFAYALGMAPAADIMNVPYSCLGIGDIFTLARSVRLQAESYGKRPLIQNNSWGRETVDADRYGIEEANWDRLVRDSDPVQPGAQPLFVGFSIGNAGPTTMTRPKAAKNILVVGATESIRPGLSYPSSVCESGEMLAEDPDRLACYSSWGVNQYNIIRPDLVAPGSWIAGSRQGGDELAGNIDAEHRWGIGTSQALPHVSGAAALFAQWYRREYGADPAPAMIKAFLILHAGDMAGPNSPPEVPNIQEGWGRLDLSSFLENSSDLVFIDQNVLLSDRRRTWAFDVNQIDPAKPIEMILAWTDGPTSIGSVFPLANNLNLSLEGNGTLYVGNRLLNGRSYPTTVFDGRNPVEILRIPEHISGGRIEVFADYVTSNAVPDRGESFLPDQDFVIIARNVSLLPREGKITLSGSTVSCLSEVTVTVEDFTARGAGTVFVEASSGLEFLPELIELTETAPTSGVFRGVVPTTTGAALPDGMVTVENGEILLVGYRNGTLPAPGDEILASLVVDCITPGVLEVTVQAVAPTSVVWNVRLNEFGRVRLGYTAPGGETLWLTSERMSTLHTLVAGGLTPDTEYTFQVQGEDFAGNPFFWQVPGLDRVRTPDAEVLLFESGEGSAPRWLLDGTGCDWRWGSGGGERNDGADGPTVLATNPDGVASFSENCTVELPSLDGLSTPLLFLEFRHRLELFFRGGEEPVNAAWIEVLDPASASWVPVAPLGGYNGTLSFNSPYPGRAVWLGATEGWQPVVADLTPYRSETVRVRLRYWRLREEREVLDGWRVDALTVWGAWPDEDLNLRLLDWEWVDNQPPTPDETSRLRGYLRNEGEAAISASVDLQPTRGDLLVLDDPLQVASWLPGEVLVVEWDVYALGTYLEEATNGLTITVNDQASFPLTLLPLPAGALYGQVRGECGVVPLVGHRVRLVSATGTLLRETLTSGDGSYLLLGVPPGSYWLQVASGDDALLPGEGRAVSVGFAAVQVDLELAGEARVSGPRPPVTAQVAIGRSADFNLPLVVTGCGTVPVVCYEVVGSDLLPPAAQLSPAMRRSDGLLPASFDWQGWDSSGTELSSLNALETAGPLTLSQPIPWLGNTYQELYVAAIGWLGFSRTQGQSTFYPFRASLSRGSGGSYRFRQSTQEATVTFLEVERLDQGGYGTLQAALLPNGIVEYRYRNLDGALLAGSTIGWSSGGSQARWLEDVQQLRRDSVLRVEPNYTWLSLPPLANVSEARPFIPIRLSAASLALGQYKARLELHTAAQEPLVIDLDVEVVPVPTNTPTPTATPTTPASPTSTATGSPTATPTSTATASPTRTPPPPPTPTATASPTGATPSPTGTPTGSPTRTPTSTPTGTATATPTRTATPSPTPSPTPQPKMLIWAAGFGPTQLTADGGGQLTIWAVTDLSAAVERVELGYEGAGVGLFFSDRGGSFWEYTLNIAPPLPAVKISPPLELRAISPGGQTSLAWPYLHVTE